MCDLSHCAITTSYLPSDQWKSKSWSVTVPCSMHPVWLPSSVASFEARFASSLLCLTTLPRGGASKLTSANAAHVEMYP